MEHTSSHTATTSATAPLRLADNLIRLRRGKKLTQEQLADFIGVTKASVSKWEKGQTLPDILLLPELASFFDVSVDALLGYEPQLSKEQIGKIYLELSADFARLPFEEVMDRSRRLMKKYYACYPFLFQLCTLWLNHFMLAKEQTRQTEILADIETLCTHILDNCRNTGICSDTAILKGIVQLQLGRTQEVIDGLKEILNPIRLSAQTDTILIQAYLTQGDTEKAASYTQMSMFSHLIAFVGCSVARLGMEQADLAACEETIRRLEALFELYDMEALHFNAASQFYYQAAAVYSTHQEKEKALRWLERFARCVERFAANGAALNVTPYFSLVKPWFDSLDIQNHAPRDLKVILASSAEAPKNPIFNFLKDDPAFRGICRRLTKGE